MRRATIGAVFTAWASAHCASAADIEVSELDTQRSLIVITGEIVKGDAAKFKRIAATIDDAVVALESEGGATIEAIEIGETIRLKDFSTLVVNDTTCTSACGLIWLSGSPRVLTTTARIGFHATYTDKSGSRMESGVGNALVGRYLGILNLPQKAIVFATSAPPESLNWLTGSNASNFGIETKIVEDFDSDENAPSKSKAAPIVAPLPPPVVTSPGRPRQELIQAHDGETTLWSRSTDWTVLVDHTLGESCYVARTFEDGTLFRIGLDRKNGNGHYFLIGNQNWTSLKVDTTYPLSVRFDKEVAWDAVAVGIDMGGKAMLYTVFEDTAFWKELASAEMVTFSRNGRPFSSFKLGDSDAAITQMIDCQKAANAAEKPRDPRDPFAE